MNIKRFLQDGIGALVQFGKGNGWFGWVSGVFKATAADKTTLVRLKIASGTDADDAVTLSQLQSKGSVIVSAGFAGDTPPSVVNGTVVMCTDTSGTFTEGVLYIGVLGVWEELTLADGQPITVAATFESTNSIITTQDGTTKEFAENHIYIWDVTTGKYLDNGAISFISRYSQKVFTNGLTGLGGEFERAVIAGTVISKVIVSVNTAKAADLTTFTVTAGGTTLASVSDVDFKTAGIYEISVYKRIFPADDFISVLWDDAVITGNGIAVSVEYTEI